MNFEPEPGMRLPTVLSAFALILALMQGALALESTEPARLSLLKAHLLLGLEFLELGIVLISEVLTFITLRAALSTRLTWLHWLAPAILAMGVCEVVLDGVATLRAVSFSRALWVPLSALGGDGGLATKIEFLCLFVTFVLSLMLVGWRQALWWRGAYVASSKSISAAQAEPLLQFTPVVVPVAFALLLLVVPAFFAAISTFFACFGRGSDGAFKALWALRQPRVWYREQVETGARKKRMHRQYGLLAKIMSPAPRKIEDEVIEDKLLTAPLHIGNTLIGADCKTVTNRRIVQNISLQHCIITIVKQVAVTPFMIFTVIALYRMHFNMDLPTFQVFEEIADAATVVVLHEFSMALKTYMWKLMGRIKNNNEDGEIELLVLRENSWPDDTV